MWPWVSGYKCKNKLNTVFKFIPCKLVQRLYSKIHIQAMEADLYPVKKNRKSCIQIKSPLCLPISEVFY